MNLVYLKKLLDDKGIRPGFYDLQSDKDFGVLRIAENSRERYWEVYFYERGRRSGEKRFYNEDEAVRYFVEELTWEQNLINKTKMRMERRSPEAKKFLGALLVVEFLVNSYKQIEREGKNVNEARPIIIEKGASGNTEECRVFNSLTWDKHISNIKKPSEFEYPDKWVLARKFMIVMERTKRLPIEGEDITEVTKQFDERTLLEEANKLHDEL